MFFASISHGFFQNEYVQIIITVIATLVLQIILRATISKLIKRILSSNKHMSAVERRKRAQTLGRVFQNISSILLWVIAVIVILAELHINLAALLTGAGLIGVVLGIAAQSMVKNYVSGIFIIMESQYQVGDIITLGNLGSLNGVSGVVEDISIRTTRLRDLDGTLHIVTNGTASVITNLTFSYAAPLINIGVSYNADLDKVEQVINDTGKAMQKDEKWKDLIVEPIQFLRVDSFNDSSITIKAVGKSKPGEQWGIAGEFRRRIKKAFDENGIEIPFPQIVLHESKKS